MIKLGENALAAKDFLATVTTEQKNKALLAIAAALRANSETIILENKKEMPIESSSIKKVIQEKENIIYESGRS